MKRDDDDLIVHAHETQECPFDDCEGVIELESTHERDSSGDRYKCTKCGWSYSQLEVWSLEDRNKL